MSKNKEAAQQIADLCKELGWVFSVRDGLLTIEKFFTPGNRDQFVKADSEYYSIFALLPYSRPGSIWGTDGGGVGALSAMKNGVFRMNKSGGNKLVLRQLEKLKGA